MAARLDRLIGPVADGDWVHRSVCSPCPGDTAEDIRQRADLFFPAKGAPTKPAKALCNVCPVRTECLAWALKMKPRHGVYGGRSERERRKLEADRVDL